MYELKTLSKALGFLFSFGVARGGLFVAPILLANLLAPADYARVEFAQAVALVGATLCGLGSAGIVPLVLLQRIENLSLKAVYFHQIACAGLSLLIAVLCFYLNLSDEIWLVAVVASFLMLQGLWSAVLKSHGKGEAALFLELGFWGGLAISVLVAQALSVQLSNRWDWIVFTLLFLWALFVVWTSRKFFLEKTNFSVSSYLFILKTGAPLMIGTLFSFLATASGRIGVGLLASPELAAAYAILFRVTALPMVAHQVITVASFRKIFQTSIAELEKKFSLIVFLVFGCAITFRVAADYVDFILGPAFVNAYRAHRKEGFLILALSVMWSAVALNELLNNRFRTASKVIIPAGIYFFISFGFLIFFFRINLFSLVGYVCAHSVVVVGFFFVQIYILWLNGVRVFKAWCLAFFLYLILFFLAIFL